MSDEEQLNKIAEMLQQSMKENGGGLHMEDLDQWREIIKDMLPEGYVLETFGLDPSQPERLHINLIAPIQEEEIDEITIRFHINEDGINEI